MSDSDGSWIFRRTVPGYYGITDEYIDGVKNFIQFTLANSRERNNTIRCPCKRCRNVPFKDVEDVELDLYRNGFSESYMVWTFHGETAQEDNSRESVYHAGDFFDPFEMLRDAAGPSYWDSNVGGSSGSGYFHEEPNEEAAKFYRLVNETRVPIYPGNTKFTKLSFVTKLLYFENSHGCSDKGFDELITLLRDVLPDGHTLPKDYYDMKKLFKGLTMDYQKIDACENDCMLYYGDDNDKDHCNYCGLPRYKDTIDGGSTTIAGKILRYLNGIKKKINKM